MSPVRDLPWPRIFAEGALIVVSILLAFAIDAWWDEREERAQESALLHDLHSDFEASQAHLELWLRGNRRILDKTQQLLGRLRAGSEGEHFESSPEWIVAAVGTPTYSPTDSTLRAAVAAGRLDLLSDEELRKALATWRQQLDDTQEDELLLRDLVAQRLVPMLAQQVRLGPAFEFEPHIGWFLGEIDMHSRETHPMQVTRPLEAALAQRVFYQRFIVDGLEVLHGSQARILELIERNIRD